MAADLSPASINPAASIPYQEWATARASIISYETTIAAIRNYGLTFVAGLLAAQGLIEFSTSTTTPPSTIVPDGVRFGILTASLVLITSLCLFEKRYTLFQSAAIARARILERRLSMSLTEDMMAVKRQGHEGLFTDLLYSSFTVAAVVLGYFILSPSFWAPTLSSLVLIVVGLVMIGLIVLLETPPEDFLIDWDVDPLTCCAGEPITVTFTNLTDRIVSFHLNTVVWEVRGTSSQGSTQPVVSSPRWTEQDSPILPGGEKVWTQDTKSWAPGSYTLKCSRTLWRMKTEKYTEKMKEDQEQPDLVPIPRQIRVTGTVPPPKGL